MHVPCQKNARDPSRECDAFNGLEGFALSQVGGSPPSDPPSRTSEVEVPISTKSTVQTADSDPGVPQSKWLVLIARKDEFCLDIVKRPG